MKCGSARLLAERSLPWLHVAAYGQRDHEAGRHRPQILRQRARVEPPMEEEASSQLVHLIAHGDAAGIPTTGGGAQTREKQSQIVVPQGFRVVPS